MTRLTTDLCRVSIPVTKIRQRGYYGKNINESTPNRLGKEHLLRYVQTSLSSDIQLVVTYARRLDCCSHLDRRRRFVGDDIYHIPIPLIGLLVLAERRVR